MNKNYLINRFMMSKVFHVNGLQARKGIICHLIFLLASLNSVWAGILIYDGDRGIEEFRDVELSNTEPINRNGIMGAIVAASPIDACDNISRPPNVNITINWFVLIAGNSCSLEVKVLNARYAGYAAAVIYTSETRIPHFIRTHNGYYTFFSNISVVVIGSDPGHRIRDNYVFEIDERISFDYENHRKVIIVKNDNESKENVTDQKSRSENVPNEEISPENFEKNKYVEDIQDIDENINGINNEKTFENAPNVEDDQENHSNLTDIIDESHVNISIEEVDKKYYANFTNAYDGTKSHVNSTNLDDGKSHLNVTNFENDEKSYENIINEYDEESYANFTIIQDYQESFENFTNVDDEESHVNVTNVENEQVYYENVTNVEDDQKSNVNVTNVEDDQKSNVNVTNVEDDQKSNVNVTNVEDDQKSNVNVTNVEDDQKSNVNVTNVKNNQESYENVTKIEDDQESHVNVTNVKYDQESFENVTHANDERVHVNGTIVDQENHENVTYMEYDDVRYENATNVENDEESYENSTNGEYDEESYKNATSREYDQKSHENATNREYNQESYENITNVENDQENITNIEDSQENHVTATNVEDGEERRINITNIEEDQKNLGNLTNEENAEESQENDKNLDKRFRAYIFPNNSFSIMTFLLLFSIVTGLFLVVMLVFAVIRFFQHSSSLQRGRLSSRHLKQLQTSTYNKGDGCDSCAICLEEYKDQDKLRFLPCSHGYHARCIDPWLTNNRPICPVCKQKVVLEGHKSDNVRDLDFDERSETTPLLQDRRDTQHGTFNLIYNPAGEYVGDLNLPSTSVSGNVGRVRVLRQSVSSPGGRDASNNSMTENFSRNSLSNDSVPENIGVIKRLVFLKNSPPNLDSSNVPNSSTSNIARISVDPVDVNQSGGDDSAIVNITGVDLSNNSVFDICLSNNPMSTNNSDESTNNGGTSSSVPEKLLKRNVSSNLTVVNVSGTNLPSDTITGYVAGMNLSDFWPSDHLDKIKLSNDSLSRNQDDLNLSSVVPVNLCGINLSGDTAEANLGDINVSTDSLNSNLGVITASTDSVAADIRSVNASNDFNHANISGIITAMDSAAPNLEVFNASSGSVNINLGVSLSNEVLPINRGTALSGESVTANLDGSNLLREVSVSANLGGVNVSSPPVTVSQRGISVSRPLVDSNLGVINVLNPLFAASHRDINVSNDGAPANLGINLSSGSAAVSLGETSLSNKSVAANPPSFK